MIDLLFQVTIRLSTLLTIAGIVFAFLTPVYLFLFKINRSLGENIAQVEINQREIERNRAATGEVADDVDEIEDEFIRRNRRKETS